MKRIIIALILISLASAPAHARSNGPIARMKAAVAAFMRGDPYDKQRQAVEKEYQTGTMSDETYRNRLSEIDHPPLVIFELAGPAGRRITVYGELRIDFLRLRSCGRVFGRRCGCFPFRGVGKLAETGKDRKNQDKTELFTVHLPS